MKSYLFLFIFLCSGLCSFECTPNAVDPPKTVEEQYDAYLCRQKVRKASQQLRQLLEKTVREKVPGFFQKIKIIRQLYPYVDALEREGLNCCENRQTTPCCIEPLVEQLQLWNSEGLDFNIE